MLWVCVKTGEEVQHKKCLWLIPPFERVIAQRTHVHVAMSASRSVLTFMLSTWPPIRCNTKKYWNTMKIWWSVGYCYLIIFLLSQDPTPSKRKGSLVTPDFCITGSTCSYKAFPLTPHTFTVRHMINRAMSKHQNCTANLVQLRKCSMITRHVSHEWVGSRQWAQH